MKTTRTESDTFGSIEVDSNRLWGAQTQRCLENFSISSELLPSEFIHALASVKLACAEVNGNFGLLDRGKSNAIMTAAREVMEGKLKSEFPLRIWQTGSGTHTNMNMNEVLANRASVLLGGETGTKRCVHPNDEVNLGQSSNDVFPTAIHVASAIALQQTLLPSLIQLRATFELKAKEFSTIIKIARTHLQDATPISLGQEFSGYASQLAFAQQCICDALPWLYPLAIGGTAVGTGMNTPANFGEQVAQTIGQLFQIPFVSADNKFAALAAHDALVSAHGTLKVLAVALLKIANDIRWLGSGPRAGLSEICLPMNEPGSSMMPGKVNPTQCEALIMACYQVIANDVAMSMAGFSGNFELNVCKPLIAQTVAQSLRLLTDGMRSFDLHCAQGITPNHERIAENLERSLMLVTALVPHIGYDRAAQIAHKAHHEKLTLRVASIQLGFVTDEEFTQWMHVVDMIAPDAPCENTH